jgi:hypothetical protein
MGGGGREGGRRGWGGVRKRKHVNDMSTSQIKAVFYRRRTIEVPGKEGESGRRKKEIDIKKALTNERGGIKGGGGRATVY